MDALLSMLLGLSVSGTVLALVLMLLRRLAGNRLPSAFYYYAWLLVLLRFLLPVPGLVPQITGQQPGSPVPAYLTDSGRTVTRPFSTEPKLSVHGTTEEAPLPTLVSEENTAVSDAEPVVSVEPVQNRWFDFKQVLLAERFRFTIWVIGMLCSALWYLGGYVRFRRELSRTLRDALPSDYAAYAAVTDEPCPRLYRSRAVSTPMLLGVLHPYILLPDRDYDPVMLQGILAHEMTHHRRHDVPFKWLSVLVSVIHWFNPITYLFRYELDRSCELACDETLLRQMNRDEKQLYGEMLLNLAASRRLPPSVVATSFAVEKRNLKERLVQIMTYKKRGKASLALILAALLLLSACGYAVGPALRSNSTLAAASVTGEPEEALPDSGETKEYTVDNIDDFLAALGSNTVIYLNPGVYDLSAAKDYGEEHPDGAYGWVSAYDGYELVIRGLDNLVIAGHPGDSGEEIVISAVPRYAQVLRFVNCSDVVISALTAGHTEEPGQCAGGVLEFDSCVNTHVTGCKLYGCGVVGIITHNSDTLFAVDTAIYQCSEGAVRMLSSKDLRLINCDIYDCPGKEREHAFNLFQVTTSTGFALLNSAVHDNTANVLLNALSSEEVYVLGTDFENNSFETLFSSNLLAPTVDGCDFGSNRITTWLNGVEYVLSPDGTPLGRPDLENMTLQAKEYDGPKLPQAAAVDGIPTQEGMEYHVTTVDEFLSAIGSDTTIYLDAELFDLSTASNYGGYGNDNYYWVDIFDGPGLVITGVENLRLIGQGKDETTVQAVPRYADVLAFDSCKNVTVANLTAGHLKEAPGSCAGDVLYFSKCQDFHVVDCGLFGCGVFGINTQDCVKGSVLRTEIYECSGGAATLSRTDGLVFTDCSVHDCYDPYFKAEANRIALSDSGDCSFNGMALWSGVNEIGDGTVVVPTPQPFTEDGIPDEPNIYVFYYEQPVNMGFTMRVGDDPVNLTAQIRVEDENGGSFYAGSDFEWTVDAPDCIKLTPSPSRSSCDVEILREHAGPVMLTVTSSDGTFISLPIYCRK